MCACRQKKSFFIEDILNDVKKKPYKNLSQEPKQPLTCKGPKTEEPKVLDYENPINETPKVSEVKVNLEQRRNTYPLHPTPLKASVAWSYRSKESLGLLDHPYSYYSDTVLSNGLLRSQLATNRFITHPLTLRQAYGFDRVAGGCCSPWWGLGGRRKGGQVRFTALQTGALERRFNASKYLSPDERRALASSLRLSDRQVKTWFQNRRAKWRRSTTDAADAGSPPTADEGSDDDVTIADDINRT